MPPCPKCRKNVELVGNSPPPNFPFCSPQCQNADLFHWLEESYRVPIETNRVIQEAIDEASTKINPLLGSDPESLN
jgi:endogenous inhibitor of DNA gyrase (YacG/DUF329 family)